MNCTVVLEEMELTEDDDEVVLFPTETEALASEETDADPITITELVELGPVLLTEVSDDVVPRTVFTKLDSDELGLTREVEEVTPIEVVEDIVDDPVGGDEVLIDAEGLFDVKDVL